MPKWVFWLVCYLIVAAGISASLWFIDEGWPDKCYYAAPVLGALLVAVGWMVTSLNTASNNEKEHTLDLIARRRADEKSEKRWELIHQYFPGQDDVLEPRKNKPSYASNDDLYLAVHKELDDGEFIAVGALRSVYDDTMLRNELELQFLKLYKVAELYIPDIQERDKDKEIWICFCKLCRNWSRSAWLVWLNRVIWPLVGAIVLAVLLTLVSAFTGRVYHPVKSGAEFHANRADCRTGQIVRMLQRLEGEVTSLRQIVAHRMTH